MVGDPVEVELTTACPPACVGEGRCPWTARGQLALYLRGNPKLEMPKCVA